MSGINEEQILDLVEKWRETSVEVENLYQDACKLLKNRFGEEIIGRCVKQLSSTLGYHEAERFADEVLNEVCKALPQYRAVNNASLRTWIYGVVKNVIIDKRETARKQRDRFVDLEYINPEEARRGRQQYNLSDPPTPEDELTDKQAKEIMKSVLPKMWEALAEIDEDDRVIILLYYWYGIAGKDLEFIYNKEQSTIRWRRKRALERLIATFEKMQTDIEY